MIKHHSEIMKQSEKLFKKHSKFIKRFKSPKRNLSQRQKTILTYSISTSDLKYLRELAHNVLNSNVPITDEQLTALSAYRKTLRDLANPKKNIKTVIQTGSGIFSIVLPAIISAIAGAVGGAAV